VQGEADMVDHFVTLAQDGPPAAKVARIEAANAPVEALNGFEKKPTA
jgi:acylphosphatase